MNIRQMGDFTPLAIGDRCPFCGKNWTDASSCGDPEPGQRKSWWTKRNPAIFEIECKREGCGRKFVSTREHAKYCSEYCKTAAYRLRRNGTLSSAGGN